MGGRRLWTTRESGFLASDFVIRAVIFSDEYDEIKKDAQKRGISVKIWLQQAASDGIYNSLNNHLQRRSIEEKR